MAGKESIKNGNKKNNGNTDQKPKTYTGVVKDPRSNKLNGRIYLKEDKNNNQSTYVLLIIVTILVGVVAMIVPAGSGVIDYFSMSNHSAADVWFGIAALIFTAAAISATLDKKLK